MAHNLNGIQFASKAIIKNNTIKNLVYNPNPTNEWANGRYIVIIIIEGITSMITD
jgi:hypothetical protein